MVPIPTRSSRLVWIPLLGVALVVMAAAAREPSPGLVPKAGDGPAAAPRGLLELPRESLSPRLLEIRDLLEDRDRQVEDLAARFRAAADDAEAMRIQREIHELKSGTEVELLKIQLRYARLEENQEAVARLQETLSRVETGPVVLSPEARPRPQTNR